VAGRALTRDPELRYIPSGSAVTSFTIAVNRMYTTQTGEKKKETCFIRVVVWGKTAETCGEYLSKGSPVMVEGRLQSRNWVGQDGQKRNTIEVVANNVQFLRTKAQAQEAAQQQQQTGMPEEDADQSAVSGNQGRDNGQGEGGEENPPF
jgi:single stranded DNA-binding protein (ssb)